MNLADLAFVPAQLAVRERKTSRAVMGSFQVNHAIVNAQAAALAVPVVKAIHQVGRGVEVRVRESDRQMDEQRASLNKHNDLMDRTSQGFSSYILDK